ncbi:MAG: VTT domain-containing protein [Bdellovibrionaceae bacterium]|nr:VTT domain-containing protein [Pseudobdellovibrionaceae bacterium]
MKWLRQFYEKCTELAQKPSALPILGAFSFIESIFFPIPTDPILIAVCAARPKRSLKAAAWAIIFSVLGGCVGFFIGHYFSDFARELLLKYFITPKDWDKLVGFFAAGSFAFTIIGAFTPIPFKVFTIAAGLLGGSFIPFVLGALVGRSLRFGLIGILFYFFGETIKVWIEAHFDKVVWAVSALIILLTALYFLI